MAAELTPGDLTTDQVDYLHFDNSLADLIDQELDRLLRLDTPSVGLSFDDNDRDVRARRRFLVAIARGVLIYLTQNTDAIDVFIPNVNSDITVHPTIHVKGF